MSNHATETEQKRFPQEDLLEQILDRSNLNRAWKRVKANKGAPGIDGMSIQEFPAFAQANMERIMCQIREGRYAPAAVKRVWIPKPNGEKRPLGIPTVLDRVIQQAVAQILGPIFEVDFSEDSYGFRQGHRAQDAVYRINEGVRAGYRWGVECDLKSFFDQVNHDLLMYQIGLKVRNKRVLRLIGKYLRAGVRLKDGSTEKTPRGVPQGGPLSPLLANIMLGPLDNLIEQMGLPFARYADDFLILARTKPEASNALDEVRRFVEGRLKLLINDDKSGVAAVEMCEFLGFNVTGKGIRLSVKSEHRFKYRVREISSRRRGISMQQRICELRRYCIGWFHYFKIGLSYKQMLQWDQWIRRRIRLYFWKSWKRPGPRRRNLMRLGIDAEEVKLASRARKGLWRMSSNSIVQRALSNNWLKEQGVPVLSTLWIRFKYGDKATA